MMMITITLLLGEAWLPDHHLVTPSCPNSPESTRVIDDSVPGTVSLHAALSSSSSLRNSVLPKGFHSQYMLTPASVLAQPF